MVLLHHMNCAEKKSKENNLSFSCSIICACSVFSSLLLSSNLRNAFVGSSGGVGFYDPKLYGAKHVFMTFHDPIGSEVVSKRVQLQARMGFELASRTAATIRGYHEFSRLGDIKSLKYSLRNLVNLTPLQFKQISQNACKMQYESTIAGTRNSINASANLLSSSNRPRWVSAAICRTSHCSSHPARACNQLPRSTIYRR